MKIRFNLLFCLLIAVNISAQEQSQVSPVISGGYLPGIMGVRDYANPGTDGLFVIDYNIFLNANSYYDRNGNKSNSLDLIPEFGGSIPIDVSISGYINSLMFTYASPKIKFLGNAQYLFIASPKFHNSKFKCRIRSTS